MLGAEDVAYLDGELYVGVDGGGAGHGNEDVPSGIYRVTGDGGAELVADLSAWTRENPVANIPPDSDPDAGGYSVVAEPSSGTLWVGDPNSGQILSVAADGAITQVIDFSEGHLVPTHLTLDPEGGVYFGILTVFPFTDGGAGVFHLGLDGTVEAVWTGLTTVVDVAVGEDGTLYALELSTGNTPESPLNPGSGRIVRQTGPDTNEVVVDTLELPDRDGDRTRRGVLRRDAGHRVQRRQRQHRPLRSRTRRRPTRRCRKAPSGRALRVLRSPRRSSSRRRTCPLRRRLRTCRRRPTCPQHRAADRAEALSSSK